MDEPIVEEVTEKEAVEAPKAPPVQSRFLFVDIAAQRAKQLRRGALPRLPELRDGAESVKTFHKLERVAMEEVRRGLVEYTLPQPKSPETGQ